MAPVAPAARRVGAAAAMVAALMLADTSPAVADSQNLNLAMQLVDFLNGEPPPPRSPPN